MMLPDETLAADAVPYTPAGFKKLGIDPAPSPAALARWRQKGLKGVRPETFMRGGRRYITRRAVAEFFAAVTAAADKRRTDSGCALALPTASAIQTRGSLHELERELEREGL